MDLEEKIRKLPHSCGVYIFKDKDNNIIYIGKANFLNLRVRSYFQKENVSFPSYQIIAKNITDVDYIITNSPIEALILEDSLIKKYQPKYNIKLRDDKQYPFLWISDDSYPYLSLKRFKKDKGEYFGPYTNTKSLQTIIGFLQKIFQIRTCKKKLDKKSKPCLNYHIKKCTAPCAGYITKIEYNKTIKDMCLFLNGNFGELISLLKERMGKEAEKLNFEVAGQIRDKIKSLLRIVENHKIIYQDKKDEDIFGLDKKGESIGVVILLIRKGRLVEQKDFLLQSKLKVNFQEILTAFIKQYYNNSNFIPDLITLPEKIKEENLIKKWLEGKKRKKVEILYPCKGKRIKLLKLAKENAFLKLKQFIKEENSLEELISICKLSKSIRKIEAFDVSNISGCKAVGSMVVFENGEPKKNQYRRFKIKLKETPNDYAMIEEIVKRRYKKKILLPDLIIIDGGKGHLNIVLRILKEINLNIPVLSIAKKFEHIYFKEKEIILKKNSPSLKYIQRIRDEAHRFAIKYHKLLREKETSISLLDFISGIGKIRKKNLLQYFGSLDKIKKAKEEELLKIKGITKEIIQKLKQNL